MDEGFNRCWSPRSWMCSWHGQNSVWGWWCSCEDSHHDRKKKGSKRMWESFHVKTIALNKEGKAMHIIMCIICTQKPLYEIHLFNCLVAQTANQAFSWLKPNAFVHPDMRIMAWWSSNWISERKIKGILNVMWLVWETGSSILKIADQLWFFKQTNLKGVQKKG